MNVWEISEKFEVEERTRGFEWDVREVGEGNKARLGGTWLRKKKSVWGKGGSSARFAAQELFVLKNNA